MHTLLKQKETSVFDKRQTNIAKGVAIILLFCHHAFNHTPSYYEKFTSLYLYQGVPIECYFSDFCKVCVAIFVFLSGYGLFKSWEKNKKLNNNRFEMKKQLFFSGKHLIKLMLDYWLIYILFVPFGIILGRPFWEVYNNNVFYGIADFLGLSYLFGTPTMNGAWWFMSVIIILYIIFPLLIKLFDYSREILFVVSILIMVFGIYSRIPVLGQVIGVCSDWLFPFVLGMFLSSVNGLELIQQHNQSIFKRLILLLLMVFLFAWIRLCVGQTVQFDAFFALSLILFSYMLLSKIPFLNKCFEELGKYSGLIFMFHEFVRIYYNVSSDFIYFFKYSFLIIVVLSIVCYMIARLIIVIKRGISFLFKSFYSFIYARV